MRRTDMLACIRVIEESNSASLDWTRVRCLTGVCRSDVIHHSGLVFESSLTIRTLVLPLDSIGVNANVFVEAIFGVKSFLTKVTDKFLVI